jgi:hypothetical protein
MSTPSYSFLPWLRQGIANNIVTPETDTSVKVRASVQVNLNLKVQNLDGSEDSVPITRPVQLYSPADIIGIDSRAIIRTDPRNWITNYEPNYLPAIEFYDEDFPWRYTPAAPDTVRNRLRPWLALIVLKEGTEFDEGVNIKDRPLPFIKLKVTGATLPRPDQLWAWVHVHINSSVMGNDSDITSDDMNAVLPRFQNILKESADYAYSRIICPRKLEPNVAYHAFLVPSFESGRLAGTGQSVPADLVANTPAWATNSPAGLELPVYYRWYFRTGNVGDFEYLVRLLEARPIDPRVGTRDMDVEVPLPSLPGITDAELGGILKLGGSLKVPEVSLSQDELDKIKKYDEWDNNPYPHPFQTALAAFINLADAYAHKPAADANSEAVNDGVIIPVEPDEPDDPLITPPLYGRWHALTERLLDAGPNRPDRNWVHNLNLDPRYRVAAGFGTSVIQDRQEQYMDAAWEQVGDVLEANRKIRAAQFAKEVSFIWYNSHIKPLYEQKVERAMTLTAPMNRRILLENFTVHHQLSESVLPPALLSTSMRRLVRPQGRLMTSLNFTAQVQPGNLYQRISSGQVAVVPPKLPQPGLPTTDDISDKLTPTNIPSVVIDLLRRFPWLVNLPFVLIALVIVATLLFFLTFFYVPIAAIIIYGLYWLYLRLKAWVEQLNQADAIRPEKQTVESVDRLPRSPDFVLTAPGDTFKPRVGTEDSVEAQKFKEALRDSNALMEATINTGKEIPLKPISLPAINNQVVVAIHPDYTMPARLLHSISIPGYLQEALQSPLSQVFQEILAYPKIDVPMYKPLVDISTELFLPNIQLIEHNSITLLETNQKFIEAYIVGVNHEFARELLWREYPSTLRGSYFRQFWDVSSFFSGIALDDPQREQKLKDLHEKLYDIPEIHTWPVRSVLGDHDNREVGGSKEDDVVLVIRGELLKKYPTAVIYAHRARWQPKSATDSSIDNTKERILDPPFETMGENPSRDFVKTPLYEAKVDPDIYFFGFDLTAEKAIGGTGERPTDDPGWFFVIKERPGEPRFGLDMSQNSGQPPPTLNVWNDLSWQHVAPAGDFIEINNTFTLVDPSSDPELVEKVEQYRDDRHIQWNPDTNAADLAYILYQAPVLIAVHASEMLRRK